MHSERERFQGITDTEYRHEGMAAGLVERFAELGDAYGAGMLQKVIRRMHEKVGRGEVMSRGELVELFAEETTRQEFQEAALRYMEKDGFVSYREDGALVVHAQKLLSEFQLDKYRIQETEYSERMGIRPRNVPGKETFGRSKVEFLANTFDGLGVVLEGEDKHAEPKPLFHLPKTSEEALDPERIRKSEFHFGLWEIPYAGQSISFRETRQPGAVEDVKFLETSIAALVYHPRYGAGERKERDRLVVKDRDGKDVLFSGAWLADRIFVRDESHHSNALNSTPVDVLMRHAPKLFRRDALRLSDFRITGEGTYEPERSRVTTSGEVSVNNVKYYLGRRFHETPIRVERVAPGLGAVVELDQENDLTGKVVATFTMYEAGDPVLTRQETGTGTAWRAGAKEVDLRDYSQESFNHLSDGESVDDLRERIEAMDRFQMVLGFDNALKRETRTRLRELPRKEIDWIRQSPELVRTHKENALALARDYERDGLELAALVADIPSVLPEMRRVLGGISLEERQVFLRGFRDFAEARKEAIVSLETMVESGEIKDEESRRARFELGSRLGEMIASVDRLVQTRRATGTQDLLQQMENEIESSIVFAQLFRDAFKGRKGVDLEKIRGVEFEARAPQELSDRDKKTMLAISEANWKDVPSMSAFIRQVTKEKLNTPSEATRWRTFKKGGNMVAFGRFDELSDGSLYAGSFNVAPKYRGSAIGDALFQNTFDVKAKDHIIHANVYPDSDVASAYVEKYGFVITDVEDVLLPGGGREVGFKILRDDSRKEEYSRSVPSSRYDLATDKDRLLSDIRNAKNRGEVVTRFVVDHENPRVRLVTFEKQAELRTPLTSLAQTG